MKRFDSRDILHVCGSNRSLRKLESRRRKPLLSDSNKSFYKILCDGDTRRGRAPLLLYLKMQTLCHANAADYVPGCHLRLHCEYIFNISHHIEYPESKSESHNPLKCPSTV